MNNEVNKALISEIALRCADVQYKDFDYNIYEQALLRADREVAKKYQVLTKIYKDNINAEEEVILKLDNFKAEFLVVCGERTLRKVTHKIENLMENCYYLEVMDGELKFAYKLTNLIHNSEEEFNELNDVLLNTVSPTQTTSNNEITILYTIIPDLEAYNGEDYLIDNKYDEERINFALVYLAKIGIIKFIGDKKQKYSDLLKLVMRSDDYDKRVIKDNTWVSMRPFNYI